jgi:hypothetical protein
MEWTPQQWENVKALFEVALEKSPAERSDYLAGATQDSRVQREVERLLAHHLLSPQGTFPAVIQRVLRRARPRSLLCQGI